MKIFTKLLKHFNCNYRGSLLLFALIFGSVSLVVIVGGVSGYAMYENRASVYKHNRELAFQIAEAGANYYRWHLAHNKTDYYDGQGATSTGPYVHDYKDKDGNIVGYFSLVITPPLLGSTVVTINSTGWMKDQPNSKRKIKIRVGFPALTDYAFLTNSDVWIGDTEVTHGKLHANGGVRYDGIGDAPITSAKPSYTCQPSHGCNPATTKPGIWGTGGPAQYWNYPVPVQNFTAVTAKLSDIRTGAIAGGIFKSSSGKQGWRVRFTADGKVKLRKVNSTYCFYGYNTLGQLKNGCLDINAETGTEEIVNMPANGFIYIEDTVWVDGVVNGRAVLGISSGKSIILNDNITYLAKDGNHVLGLISPQDVLIRFYAPEALEIDAALLAQNGSAQRYYYPSSWYPGSSHVLKDSIYIYGSVISGGVWTWSWVSCSTCPVISGYKITNSTYDANLTYGPPPGFPVGNEYNLISWEEVEY